MANQNELTSRIEKAVGVLKAAGAREVHLFGSAAKGTLRENSEVDMAVSGLPPEVFFRPMAQASRPLGRPLDLINLDRDNPFTRYLKEEGELHRVGRAAQRAGAGTATTPPSARRLPAASGQVRTSPPNLSEPAPLSSARV